MYQQLNSLCRDTLAYLKEAQDLRPGEYFGSFWSEKAYHAPLLDWHGGGSHHHRGAGSAGLAFYLTGDKELQYRAEHAFDWLVSRQKPRGGWTEIQNNETDSDWEFTGMEELSNIETSFAIRGIAQAIQQGLPPKKSYLDAMRKAGLWYIGLETPAWSGAFPHHERSPYDTLNGTMHAVEALGFIYSALKKGYGLRVDIFRAAAFRGLRHLIPQQWDNGCFPYRSFGGITINYSALVLYLILNFRDNCLPEEWRAENIDLSEVLRKGVSFLCASLNSDGSLKWEENETSCAKHYVWTYALVFNVFKRMNCRDEAEMILKKMLSLRTPDGLLPMLDNDPDIIHCAYMQADILLFLMPFTESGNS